MSEKRETIIVIIGPKGRGMSYLAFNVVDDFHECRRNKK